MKNLTSLSLILLLAALLPGCATKKYAEIQVAESEARVGERVDGVESMVEANQDELDRQSQRLDNQEAELGTVSATAQEALDRAMAAGKLAQGKLVYERVLSDEEVLFAVGTSELSEAAKRALDDFAGGLIERNQSVYVEIQGHTDATGSESRNMALGLERAEAVRLYLNQAHGFPLHRTSVISYGEAAPIADNSTRAGRAQNRRVSLVVLE